MMSDMSIALVIFGIAYLVIVTERIHKTIVALSGAALMIALGVITQDEAFYSHEFGVDYNVVFLLIGMMVIVNIVRETGLFEVLAIWAAQRARAKPFVSFPLAWEELEESARQGDPERLQVLHSAALNRTEQEGDLFREVLRKKQKLPHL